MKRVNVSSGSPYEPVFGISRAVRAGNIIEVSGTAPIAPDGTNTAAGDAYGQAMRCFEIIKSAIEEAGGKLADVVRTRMFLSDISCWQDVARAHGEYFKDIRPASTVAEVTGFVDPDWLVEIEAECVLTD